MNDSLKSALDTVASTKGIEDLSSNSVESGTNWWLVLAVIEFGVILLLLYKFRSQKRVEFDETFNELKTARSSEIDMDNLMNSIHGSRDLYKELSRKCHPDRFQNEELRIKADAIFQEISKSRRDYQKLDTLKKRASLELGVTF